MLLQLQLFQLISFTVAQVTKDVKSFVTCATVKTINAVIKERPQSRNTAFPSEEEERRTEWGKSYAVLGDPFSEWKQNFISGNSPERVLNTP